jgi:hypothetical protein
MRTYRYCDLKPAGVPFTRKHVTTLEKRGEFPQHFDLGQHSIAWVATEVDAWVENKIRRRNPIVANGTPASAPPPAPARRTRKPPAVNGGSRRAAAE